MPADDRAGETAIYRLAVRKIADAYSHLVQDAAAHAPGGTVNAATIVTLTKVFEQKLEERLVNEMRESIEDYFESRERKVWQKGRNQPFDRLLVYRIAPKLPKPGQLEEGVTHLFSRRVLAGFFNATRMLAGNEIFAQCHERATVIHDRTVDTMGRDFDWRVLFEDEDVNRIVDDFLVAVAVGFMPFDERFRWFTKVVENGVAPADNYLYEGEGVVSWEFNSRIGANLLRQLFQIFAERLNTPAYLARMQDTHGADALRAVQTLLQALWAEASATT